MFEGSKGFGTVVRAERRGSISQQPAPLGSLDGTAFEFLPELLIV